MEYDGSDLNWCKIGDDNFWGFSCLNQFIWVHDNPTSSTCISFQNNLTGFPAEKIPERKSKNYM